MTVIVPAYNEESDIADCMGALAAQTLPRDRFEVMLVDGCSTDRTVLVAQEEASRHDLDLRVISNPERTAATALNLGLEESRGSILVRVDARSRVAPDHLERCERLLNEDPTIGVVGGGQHPVPRAGANLVARGIARSLANRYTTGLARYRRGGAAGPVDTVWMGAFRREDLERVGGWPTFPIQNQDYRLNQRLRSSGLSVWFDPDLTADYLPRADLAALARQYRAFGESKGWVWTHGEPPSGRHVALLIGVGTAAVASVLAVRRVGPFRVVAGWLAVGLALDHIGQDHPGSVGERLTSTIATAVADSSWLAGVALGAVRSWRRA